MKKKKVKFGIFAVDITEYLGDDIRSKSGRVFEINLSRLQQVFCCELTPSYELEAVDYVSEHGLDDDDHDALYEAIFADSEITYMHCKEAMKLPHEIDVSDYDDDMDLEECYQEFYDYVRANPSFDPFLHIDKDR